MKVKSIIEWLKCCEPVGKSVLGFDAFIDSIVTRIFGLGEGEIKTMDEMGKRLIEKNNTSGVIQLSDLVERAGGNMVNTARTLSSLGADVTCFGPFGLKKTYSVFEPLAEKCKIYSFADPAQCLAIEFEQNKLFFSSNGELDKVSWDTLVERIGHANIVHAYDEASVIGLFNWGELRNMQQIWEGLRCDIFPRMEAKERMIFVDFSDVSARNSKDLSEVMTTLKGIRQYGKVTISANVAEASFMCAKHMLEDGAADVFIEHAKNRCTLHTKQNCISVSTRFCKSPKLLTGGGDNFNAGYLYGRLTGLCEEDSMKVGAVVASCYIRHGETPEREELFNELLLSESIWG